jgi:hypothetical protein
MKETARFPITVKERGAVAEANFTPDSQQHGFFQPRLPDLRRTNIDLSLIL